MRVVSTHPSDHRHTNALKAALQDIPAPGWAVVFGDRHEMAVEALRLHYHGINLVHVGAGDTMQGADSHPDHRTRDAISMLARVHCVSNEYAKRNLRDILPVMKHVYVTGSPGLDEVVAYAQKLDPKRVRRGVFEWFPETAAGGQWEATTAPRLTQMDFLHRIAHCELFRTNSSAGLYEAPIFETPVELVGDRQKGRRGPFHHPEGKSCELIAEILRKVCV